MTITQMCERCDALPRVKGERFCKACKKIVKQELTDAGYLQQYYRGSGGRGVGSSEDRRETKGHTSPSWDNVVRAAEEG